LSLATLAKKISFSLRRYRLVNQTVLSPEEIQIALDPLGWHPPNTEKGLYTPDIHNDVHNRYSKINF